MSSEGAAAATIKQPFFKGRKMKAEWEEISTESMERTERLKVDGGYLYHRITWPAESQSIETGSMCFVPDVDLQRYQAHLRDAYNKGFADGLEEAVIQSQPKVEKAS